METLLELDQTLFALLNGTWRTDFLDRIAPIWRTADTWILFYLFLSIYIFAKLKWKQGVLLIACAAATTGVGDFTSSKIVKPAVERLRPCNDAAIPEILLLDNCGSGYSFTSSHATNHFALAMFLFFTAGAVFNIGGRLVLVAWAASVAYAQVYVGVHYPFDILGGALLGTGLAWLGALGYRRLTERLSFPKKSAS